jgi:predicted metal-dependent phosphoesterase TrpH
MKQQAWLPVAIAIILFTNTEFKGQNLNRQVFPDMELKNQRRLLVVPDIEGFITLKGDFHMHTVFSDGSVWPEVRVDEAWQDGLDVIAITDHDRYHPNKEYLIYDNNTHYKLAEEAAKNKGILLIPGIEVTRKMPPGHFNAFFVRDANLPEMEDTAASAFLTVMEKLHDQGAVMIWNHPGWIAQQKDTVKWFPVHQHILEKGWLQGIEVFNYNEWYPIALQWADEKKLAPFANSDVHDPMRLAYDYSGNFIRPMTLVFVKERSAEAIRKAILDRQTVAWFNGNLAGSEALLGHLFDKSVSIQKVSATNGKTKYLVSNMTDFTIHCQGLSADWTGKLELTPRSAVAFNVPDSVSSVDLEVTNWHTGMKENLKHTWNLSR